MDSSNGQHQEMSTQSLETMLVCSKTQQEKKPRPQQDQALKCPRCDSTNTKFCYYNNYSLTQPRYFCKSCRRYWTKGGTLRNVPVGGGCRKNKRHSSKRSQDQQQPLSSTHLPSLTYHDCDVSILGNPNNTHCDIPIFGNSFGFLDNPNGFNANMYYGLGNGGMAEEMVLPYGDMSGGGATTTAAVTVTTMKEEFCSSNGREGDGRVLWGFPWQIGGDGMMGDVESVRESFNGLAPWHGLLNSPLM